jgi:Uma2 family endonuclease
MNNAVETVPNLVRGAQVWPLSVSAYRVLGEAGLIPKETELLYGIVYRKMSKSPYHSALVTRIFDLLTELVPQGFFIRCEQPITCELSEPEPDLAVIRGEKKDFWEEHPHTAELVIEICVTSLEYDRSKLRAYATAGGKECWLVLGPEQEIEVYQKPESGEYSHRTVLGRGGNIASVAVPGLRLSLEVLFTK